nr:AMP-binding protein [Cellulomonas sp. APG4]
MSALEAALEGTGPALAPGRPRFEAEGDRAGDADGGATRAGHVTVPGEVAVVLRTSGSTGDPRDVMIDAAALHASARATHARLGGPGRWVLALPTDHVAGVQVLVRSLDAGRAPVVVRPGRFDPAALASAVARAAADGAPVHTALVPTQLHRVVEAAGDALTGDLAPLLDLTSVLVGGAGTPAPLLDRAHALGLPVITTYGMTETAGGCVYDGTPLDGVSVRTEPDGRVLLAGPVLARGVLGRPELDARLFVEHDGRRWLRTTDVGEMTHGALRVLGRADDVIVTGGVNVAPAAVEDVITALAGVRGACVVGVPDPEWGRSVVAVVVPAGAAPSLDQVRDAVRRRLGPAAAPRHLVLVDALPERGPGKTDRAGAARLAAHRLAVGPEGLSAP